MSISLLSNAQTKINPARLLQGTSGSGSVFLKSDNSGNVSFSNNLNGGVLSGLGNGVLSSDAVNLGQLQGSVNGSIGYLAKFTGGNSVGNSLVYDNGTNVGIGTTSPISRLHVTTSSASTSYVTIGNVNNGLLIGVAANGENQVLNYASKGLVFGGNYNGTQTEQMRIDGNGNVGIGTSSPSQKLHVAGSIRVDNYIFGYNNRGVFGSDAGGSYLGSLGGSTSTLPTYVAAENAPIRFHNNSVERMRITEAGNVGIGTVSPQYKLDVNGTVGIRSDLNMLTTNTQIIGGFGAGVSSGALDWNDVSNARSGNGYTLLLGSATNGTGLEPSTYYHPFSFEYNSRNGSGNMTQFAIPYTVGNNSGKLHFRARYSGVWSDWQRIPTQAQIDADYGKLIGINNWTGSNTFVGITANTVQANYNIIAKGTLQGYSGAGIFMSYETYGGRFESYDYSTGSWKNIAISPNGGNVGIGTTTPVEKLHVNGNLQLGGNSVSSSKISLNRTTSAINSNYSVLLSAPNSPTIQIGYGADYIAERSGNAIISAPFYQWVVPASNQMQFGRINKVAGAAFTSADEQPLLTLGSSGNISHVLLDMSTKKITNLANGTASTDAVTLAQAQDASNLTTGTIPDARISSNIARVDNSSNLMVAGAFSGGNSFSSLSSSIDNYVISSYNSANSTNDHSIYLSDLATNVNSKTVSIVNIANTSVATGAVIRIYPPSNYLMSLTKNTAYYELVLDAANTTTSDNFTGTNKWKVECTVIRSGSRCNCFLVKN